MMGNGMTLERYEHIEKYIDSLDLDLENGKILNRDSYSLSTKGYYRVRLGSKLVYQHQIFAATRWGKKCIGMTVNHKNEVKTDNSWTNLELLTNEENINARTRAAGVILTPIKGTNIATGEVLIFPSQQEAGRKLGIKQRAISLVVTGSRRKTHGWIFERVVI